jgi:hypothetical protein
MLFWRCNTSNLYSAIFNMPTWKCQHHLMKSIVLFQQLAMLWLVVEQCCLVGHCRLEKMLRLTEENNFSKGQETCENILNRLPTSFCLMWKTGKMLRLTEENNFSKGQKTCENIFNRLPSSFCLISCKKSTYDRQKNFLWTTNENVKT